MLTKKGKILSMGSGPGGEEDGLLPAMSGCHELFITQRIFNKLILGARPWGNGMGGRGWAPSKVLAFRELTAQQGHRTQSR